MDTIMAPEAPRKAIEELEFGLIHDSWALWPKTQHHPKTSVNFYIRLQKLDFAIATFSMSYWREGSALTYSAPPMRTYNVTCCNEHAELLLHVS